MRTSRNALVTVWGACLLTFAGCVLAYPAVKGEFARTLSVTGPVEVEVTTGSGSIDIRSGSSSSVQVHGIIRAGDDWHNNNAQEKVRYLEANPPIEQNGNFIRIGRIENESYRNNVSISYEITVPADTRVRSKTGSGSESIAGIQGPVEASTGSGSIRMTDIGNDVLAHTGSGSIHLDGVSGDVEASTGSGSITARRIEGSIQAKTGSGSVSLEQTVAEQGRTQSVDVSTGSGRIEASGVRGPVLAKTGSGGITISGNPIGDWNLSASSGSVNLQLEEGAAFSFHARSSSGAIRVNLPLTEQEAISKREMRGKVRGGGNLVEIRSGSGGITIR